MGGFDNYIQQTSAQKLGDEGIKWRIILEQQLESGRRPLYTPEVGTTSSSEPTGDAPSFYSSPSSSPSEEPPHTTADTDSLVEVAPRLMSLKPADDLLLPNLPPPEPRPAPIKQAQSIKISPPGLLFAREFRKRDPNAPPRIPIFSKTLQREFVRKNVTRSFLDARSKVRQRSAVAH